MPATKTKPAVPTEEQQLKKTEEAVKWAKERLLDPNTLILDVETTGMLKDDPNTEIVSLSLINTKGQIVLSSLVNPGRPIPLAVQKIHGIEDRDVKSAMPWSVIGDILAYQIANKHVVCFNAGFDVHLVVHLCGKYGIPMPEFEVSCAMEYYAQFVGEWSKSKGDYKWVWKTGEELLFRHVKKIEDYNGFHGHEYPFIGWNEITKYPTRGLYDKFMSVNRCSFDPVKDTPKVKKGTKLVYNTPDEKALPPIPLEVFVTTNPNGPGHNWCKEEFVDPAPPGHLVKTTTEM